MPLADNIGQWKSQNYSQRSRLWHELVVIFRDCHSLGVFTKPKSHFAAMNNDTSCTVKYNSIGGWW